MARAPRFVPPTGLGELIPRPRLLDRLRQRFTHPLTTVVAGSGFGKTTLLGQAVHANEGHPVGIDVWLSCEPTDAAASSFATDLAAALWRGPPAEALGVAALAEVVTSAIWQRSPRQIALILDDVQEVPPGSTGVALLQAVLDALPANGHLVLVSRDDPPVRRARLAAQGQVLELDEDDLAFDGDELRVFASRRAVDLGAVEGGGGWPALTELAASAGHSRMLEYLWEELLAALPRSRRRRLAALVAVGGGDRAIASAAAGEPVDPGALVAGLPLVNATADGWFGPHALWRDALADELTTTEVRDARRRVADLLVERSEVERAVELLAAGDDWERALAVAVEGCVAVLAAPPADAAAGWLRRLPADLADTPEARLLEGIALRTEVASSAARAAELLARAAAEFAEREQPPRELAALAQLSYVGWIRGDRDVVSGAVRRGLELGAAGGADAPALAALGRATYHDAVGEDDAVLEVLDTVGPTVRPGLRAGIDWFRVNALITLGRAAEALEVAEAAGARGSEVFQQGHLAPLVARWAAGHPLEVLEQLDAADPGAVPTRRFRLQWQLLTALAAAFAGRPPDPHLVPLPDVQPDAGLQVVALRTMTEAARAISDGDEPGAAASVRAFLADHPFDEPLNERALRRYLAPVYVLIPETRRTWDAAALGPSHRRARALAAALVAGREGAAPDVTATSVDDVLTDLPLRWAVELGVVATAGADGSAGRSLLGNLLDRFGETARSTLRDLTGHPAKVVAGTASRLLADVPATPEATLVIRVLGPMTLIRDGRPVEHPDWRRERVRSLLALLVDRREVSRNVAMTMLWPELDEEAAGRNLRVNLAYLQRVLEPDRARGEAHYFLRQVGDRLRLAGTERLQVDSWQLEELLDRAAAAEDQGAPSVTLRLLTEALELWRGEYLVDPSDADWASRQQDRVRARVVAAAVRAAELRLGAGDADEAAALADRAIAAEPWSEAAYRALVAAYLQRGDRAAARRALDRCHAMLDDLGAEPEPATRMLEEALANTTLPRTAGH